MTMIPAGPDRDATEGIMRKISAIPEFPQPYYNRIYSIVYEAVGVLTKENDELRKEGHDNWCAAEDSESRHTKLHNAMLKIKTIIDEEHPDKDDLLEGYIEQIANIAYEAVGDEGERDTGWRDLKIHQPKPGTRVLVICDYTKWNREKVVHVADVHHTVVGQKFGGPNALTGSGTLYGLYFALPAICAPGVVTKWQPLPTAE